MLRRSPLGQQYRIYQNSKGKKSKEGETGGGATRQSSFRGDKRGEETRGRMLCHGWNLRGEAAGITIKFIYSLVLLEGIKGSYPKDGRVQNTLGAEEMKSEERVLIRR